MATKAIKRNKIENEHYSCEHICIEPYEIEWLERLNVKVIREIVEKTDIAIFSTLDKNDILFIDSSHIIRPQGDVLFEYLEILPILKQGVLVHIHDIFTPEDYPDDWIKNAVFWNEQYLLEAFLSFNNNFRIIAAVNFLKNNNYDQLSSKCPITKMLTDKGEIVGAGSFWSSYCTANITPDISKFLCVGNTSRRIKSLFCFSNVLYNIIYGISPLPGSNQ